MSSRTMVEQPLFKAIVVLIIGTLVAIACAIPAGYAHAKTWNLETAKGTIHLYPGLLDGSNNCGYWELYSRSESSATPKKVKLSNKRNCQVTVNPGMICVDYEKAGKATLSYKWKGKTHKVKLVMHPWTSPVKSFKLGNKQYVGKFKKAGKVQVSSKYLTGKLKVQAASGWKIEGISTQTADYDSRLIKSGANLKKSSKVRQIHVTATNKKSGYSIAIVLNGKGYEF